MEALMNYGEVLSNAWKTIWKHKVLWIFGILAGLGAGGGGGGGGRNGVNYNVNGQNFNNPNFPFGPEAGYQVQNWLEQNWWVILVILAFLFFLFLVFVVLSTFGRIGLARGTWLSDEGQQKIGFGELFVASGPYFWRVLLLAILVFVLWLAFGILVALMVGGVALFTLGIGLICLIPLLCLLVPVGWAVNIIVEQAIVAIVGDNLGVIDGIKKGWEVFRTHLGESIVMGLILFVGRLVVGFILAIPIFIILLPLFGSLFFQSQSAFGTGAIISLVLFCIYLPIAIVLNGLLTAYISAAWALTYRRLTGRQPAQPAAEVVPAA
jgi:hypothetical protein